MRMVRRTQRDLLGDPASSDTIHIHTLPGILLFYKKTGTKNHGSVAKKVYTLNLVKFFYYFLCIFSFTFCQQISMVSEPP
jgi:hypothetical protein